jgi:acetyltransferase EpsM
MVEIGDGTYVGMGATVLDNISIGKGCTIGAGSVVTKDLPDAVKVVGVPARIVETGVEPK